MMLPLYVVYPRLTDPTFLRSFLKMQNAQREPGKTHLVPGKIATFPPLTSVLSWHLIRDLIPHQNSLIFLMVVLSRPS